MDWWQTLWQLVQPTAPPSPTTTHLGLLIGVALVLVLTPVWTVLRLFVTLVHELGHALVGMLAGRRFTGFVLRGDAAGHAVTHGRTKGAGLAWTTWAGYPAPAIVGALLLFAAGRGWAAPAFAFAVPITLLALTRVRSWLTAAVTLAALALEAAVLWFLPPAQQAGLLALIGLILLVGAWRALGAVWRDRSASSDPAALARLTRVPRWLWLVTFALVCLAATALPAWLAWRAVA